MPAFPATRGATTATRSRRPDQAVDRPNIPSNATTAATTSSTKRNFESATPPATEATIDSVDWADEVVYVERPRAQVENAPEFDDSVEPDETDRERLGSYYSEHAGMTKDAVWRS